MKCMRVISVIYGTCCLVVVCALLFLMLLGTQSALGFNISLLFLSVFWSGVPVLLYSAYSLKSKRTPSRRTGIAALAILLAPAIVCLVGQISAIAPADSGHEPAIASSLALTFLPALISLVLLLILLKGGSHEEG